jgi:hypothetical protein
VEYRCQIGRRSLVFSGLFVLGLLTMADAAGIRGSVPPDKEQAMGPLQLEVMVLLDKSPATLLMRATNISRGPVDVHDFYHPKNFPIVVRPDGVAVECIEIGETFGKVPPIPPETMKPGQVKEWEFVVGNALEHSSLAEPGNYRVRWKINGQTSDEIRLFRRKRAHDEAEGRDAAPAGPSTVPPKSVTPAGAPKGS